MGLAASAAAQPPASPSWRFDFGPGAVAAGHQQVMSTSAYAAARGFGFVDAAAMLCLDRATADILRSDFCTSDRPFVFAVDVPEGNYAGDRRARGRRARDVDDRQGRVAAPDARARAHRAWRVRDAVLRRERQEQPAAGRRPRGVEAEGDRGVPLGRPARARVRRRAARRRGRHHRPDRGADGLPRGRLDGHGPDRESVLRVGADADAVLRTVRGGGEPRGVGRDA